MNIKNKKIILSVIVCAVIGVLSFFSGVSYGKGKSVNNSSFNRAQIGSSFGQENFNQRSQGGKNSRSGIGSGGGIVSGEILSKDETSMTVKLRDGGSKIVFFAPSTKIEKTVGGTISDTIIGKQVMITGVTNTDGSVSATSIQIRP